MISLNLTNVKDFMSHLLLSETFDNFYFIEGEIVTFNTFTIDGYIQKDFFDSDAELTEYSYWKNLREYCFSLIRGKRLPDSFHIILKLAPKDVYKVAGQSGGAVRGEDIEGMYLNIRYENRELACITGLSMKTFTMDKTMDGLWDETVKEFFRSKGIV